MTTIATRGDGIIAADSQCVWSNRLKLRVSKLHRLKGGGVLAGAGRISQILAVLEWYEGGMRFDPPESDDCDVLVASPDGWVATICANGLLSYVKGPVALGTGNQAAMAAMVYFGASAEEAVMAAAEVDPNTSAPVDVMRVEPKAKKPARRNKDGSLHKGDLRRVIREVAKRRKK